MQQNKDGVQKLFKQFGLFSLALTFSSSMLCAASFEDFKRSQVQSFQEYKDEKDAKFNKFLTQQWNAYEAHKSQALYEKPKPKKIPKTSPSQINKVGPLVNVQLPSVKEKQPSEEKPKDIVVVIKPKQKLKDDLKKDIEFDFFGSKLEFNISDGIKSANFYPTNQKGISNFFNKIVASDHEYLLSEIKDIQKELDLNDWGVYLLVSEISKNAYKNKDNANLLSWIILNKLGYAVKVGLANNHIVLLHYSDKTIYSTPSYKFGNDKFYAISYYAKGSVGRVYSYEQNYPGSDKSLDLSLQTVPNFVNYEKTKQIGFSANGEEFKIPVVYNKNLIDFMATYPQADYDTFFNAPLDIQTAKQLTKGIKKYVDGKKMSEALNFVLHFVQKSFKYEIDQTQFGREKVMFAQETLYYDKSDCEDRAVLFSYLVKDLFKIDVIGVKYSDHMATALYIPMQGDSVKAGRKRYVLADPTYINSNIGESMPKYKPKIPDSFILVKK